MYIRSRAPLRLGIAGGGTDCHPYCDEYGGVVLNATINMYAYCTIEPTNDNKIILEAHDRNEYYSSDSKSYLPLDDGQMTLFKGVYNHVVKNYNYGKALSFKAFTYSDAPAGSGLGTSSTMVVAILKCFVEWLGLPLGDYDIAREAYIIEREELKLSGGMQDQYAAAFGGFNFMEFNKDSVVVNPLRIKKWILTELESSLVLYYMGVSRSSAAIINEQIKNTESKNVKTLESMHAIKASAYKMKEALLKGNFSDFADYLNQAWEAKKKAASTISNKLIEEEYDFIMENGGKAAKVSGAGGGGFMMIFCAPEQRCNLIEKLKQRNGRVFTISFTESSCQGWTIYNDDLSKRIDTYCLKNNVEKEEQYI